MKQYFEYGVRFDDGEFEYFGTQDLEAEFVARDQRGTLYVRPRWVEYGPWSEKSTEEDA